MIRKMLSTAALILVATAAHAEMALTSPDIAEGKPLAEAQVLNGFGCTGGNVSPALEWTGVPEGTKSFVVTAYDPDAPTGSGWWHWTVFNIPASATGLPANVAAGTALPQGAIQGRTDFGTPGFGGACPPAGDEPHRYIFTIHALKVDTLPLDENAPAAMLGFYTRANELGRASITATYGR